MVFLKNGKLSKMAHCSECKKDMHMSSVTEIKTAESYGKWVAEYPGFFKMIDFDKWSKRLRNYGMASPFWDAYHVIKPKRELDEDGYGKAAPVSDYETSERKRIAERLKKTNLWDEYGIRS